jgi:hypothetical protein
MTDLPAERHRCLSCHPELRESAQRCHRESVKGRDAARSFLGGRWTIMTAEPGPARRASAAALNDIAAKRAQRVSD